MVIHLMLMAFGMILLVFGGMAAGDQTAMELGKWLFGLGFAIFIIEVWTQTENGLTPIAGGIILFALGKLLGVVGGSPILLIIATWLVVVGFVVLILDALRRRGFPVPRM